MGPLGSILLAMPLTIFYHSQIPVSPYTSVSSSAEVGGYICFSIHLGVLRMNSSPDSSPSVYLFQIHACTHMPCLGIICIQS